MLLFLIKLIAMNLVIFTSVILIFEIILNAADFVVECLNIFSLHLDQFLFENPEDPILYEYKIKENGKVELSIDTETRPDFLEYILPTFLVLCLITWVHFGTEP